MDEQPTEQLPDVPPPGPVDEEIVDPTIPEGNARQVTIKRHPFGLVALYAQVIVAFVAAFGLIYFLVPSLISGDTKDSALHWLMLLGLLAGFLAAVFLLIATYIYNKNYWIVTDDSINQHLQAGLFRRTTSGLSMANIEDVTAEQNGILAELFGFGTLRAETAGETPNFHFVYCPKPQTYAKIILDARERFIESDPRTAKRANDLLNVPRS